MTIPGLRDGSTIGQATVGRPPAPPGLAQKIRFTGSLTDGKQIATKTFVVLAGDGPPTVTGGWAKWATIDRPQRVGLTVLQGYDPMSMTVPILFDSVTTGGDSLEDDIATLEWMAGRGRLYDGSPFSPAFGENPLVTITTTDPAGNSTPLVPESYQGDAINWLVTDIAHGDAYRDRHGQRVRQATTVTLTQFVGNPFSTGNDSPTKREQARKGLAGKTVTFSVTKAVDTFRKIAAHYGNPADARAIQKANKANKDRRIRSVRSVDHPLPLQAKVLVPASIAKL